MFTCKRTLILTQEPNKQILAYSFLSLLYTHTKHIKVYFTNTVKLTWNVLRMWMVVIMTHWTHWHVDKKHDKLLHQVCGIDGPRLAADGHTCGGGDRGRKHTSSNLIPYLTWQNVTQGAGRINKVYNILFVFVFTERISFYLSTAPRRWIVVFTAALCEAVLTPILHSC